ncbi:hypothetical protein BME99_01995 [Pseudomonas protegens]|nr:hypothetical protein BME99_01995 [Pseudomonas protegens]
MAAVRGHASAWPDLVTVSYLRAPLFDLLACADQCIRALHKLVNSLSCLTAQTADASDLFQITDIASLLLGDGVALLDVAQGRAMESADRAS